MILTCPACASRYLIEADTLPVQGRKVRCSACGQSWRAEPQAADPSPPAATSEPDGSDGPPSGDAQDRSQRPEAEALPRAFRQKAQARRRLRHAMTAGVVWGGAAAGCALLLLSAVLFRVQVVRLWPRTAGAYAAVRLPVNPLGLAPDNVHADEALQDGRLALVVGGGERNIEDRPQAPAPLRVSLYDKGGTRLVSRIVRLAPEPIAVGAVRAFAVSLPDPPLAGVQVAVDFLVEPQALAASAAPRLRGLIEPGISTPGAYPSGAYPSRASASSAPVSSAPVRVAPRIARALPAGSLYALPAAARPQAD